jgi:predicted nucleic acid-binding protein
MITNKQEIIYLDANFLIRWAVPKTSDIRRRFRFLLATLINQKNLTSSCLAIDEAWYSIKKEYNTIKGAKLSCSDDPIFGLLYKFTNEILQQVKLLQFVDPKKGTKMALSNIGNFKLGPRDAFHLSLMQDNSIKEILTDDGDFIRIKSMAQISVVQL